MRLTQRITELCLTLKGSVTPFAVIVEQGEYCSWSMSTGNHHELNQQWAGYVLSNKERRPSEWWIFDVWREWLDEIVQEPSDRRIRSLERLEATTPGVVVRCPREVHTRLPVGAIASHWRRSRLFDRTDTIMSEIAINLAKMGTAHWASALTVNDYKPLAGDWIIERQSMLEMETSSINGLAIIQAIHSEQIDELKNQWIAIKNVMKAEFPCNVAIVRGTNYVEVLEIGCIIGEKFPSPVSLAIAVVRSQWHKDVMN